MARWQGFPFRHILQVFEGSGKNQVIRFFLSFENRFQSSEVLLDFSAFCIAFGQNLTIFGQATTSTIMWY